MLVEGNNYQNKGRFVASVDDHGTARNVLLFGFPNPWEGFRFEVREPRGEKSDHLETEGEFNWDIWDLLVEQVDIFRETCCEPPTD